MDRPTFNLFITANVVVENLVQPNFIKASRAFTLDWGIMERWSGLIYMCVPKSHVESSSRRCQVGLNCREIVDETGCHENSNQRLTTKVLS
jgi:hypothetical protein